MNLFERGPPPPPPLITAGLLQQQLRLLQYSSAMDRDRIRTLLVLLFLCGIFAPETGGLPTALLYDYKLSETLRLGDEISSLAIPLKIPIVFYGTPYRSIYVSYQISPCRGHNLYCIFRVC